MPVGLGMAGAAQAAQLGFVVGQNKPGRSHFTSQLPAKGRVGKLGHGAAVGTDNQEVVGFAAGVQAGRPCIDGVKTMDQALFDQEIKRTVNRGRRSARLDAADFVQQLVRLDAAALFEKNFEHFAAYGRKALATFVAEGLGGVQLGRHGARCGGFVRRHDAIISLGRLKG